MTFFIEIIEDKKVLVTDVYGNFNLISDVFNKNVIKSKDVKFIESDGLKIIWDNKWIHIRKSNTEPIIRIISEAENHKTAKDLVDYLRDNISL